MRVARVLRELCVFAEHDLLRHPPFTRMDLVSCRNVLIYFNPQVQQEILARFHYALAPGGLLLLGKSECSESVNRLFEPLDGANRLYRRRDLPTPAVNRTGSAPALSPMGQPPPDAHRPASAEAALRDLLLARYAPPSVVLDDRLQPLHFHGDCRRYLSLPEGEADLTLAGLCHPALRGEVRTAVHLVLHQGQVEVRGHPVPMEIDGAKVQVRVVARRAATTVAGREVHPVVSFEETPTPTQAPSAGVSASAESNAAEDLLQELQATRGHLHAIIGELEASNAEMQSLNEELQVSAEELQSTNEELQASNEELTTLNDELRSKGQELTALNDLLNSIQDSVQLALVVVDGDYRVRRFGAQARRIFGLVEEDLGRSLAGVPCTLPLPDLRREVEAVFAGGAPVVQRVGDGERQYLMQIAPHTDQAGRRLGAVLSFADISDLAQAEAQAREAEERLREAKRLAGLGHWRWDLAGDTHIWSKEIFEIYGRDPSLGPAKVPEVSGYFTPESWAQLDAAVQEGLDRGTPCTCDAEVVRPDGTRRWVTVRSRGRAGPRRGHRRPARDRAGHQRPQGDGTRPGQERGALRGHAGGELRLGLGGRCARPLHLCGAPDRADPGLQPRGDRRAHPLRSDAPGETGGRSRGQTTESGASFPSRQPFRPRWPVFIAELPQGATS